MQRDPQASSSEEEVLLDHYRIIKTLGTGNFAQVKLALHLHTKVQVALKTLEKDKKNAALIANELEIMKLLDHPNITKLFHVIETTKHIYMVLEYAPGGDLASRILEVEYMQEGEARYIFTQMVCAVKYCHENGIAHRDIKPENILMDTNRNIKLCDFGLAIKVTTEQKSTVFCGTLPYCAPELFSSQGYDPRALDIWSMGVVLYIMVTKHYPFKATTYEKMKEEMQVPHYYIPPTLSALIANLIVQLFTIDPGQRPKIQDIMEHQWLKGNGELSKLTLPPETLPQKPKPSIMVAMWNMGYNPKDIRDSLHENKFNSIMATYLILKHQSAQVDNTDHNVKLMQPGIDTAPGDPPTCHLFLKKIGCEPDHSTSTLPEKCQSHDDDKLESKKDSKNHGMPTIECCEQKSLSPSIGAQCGPVQHGHEQPVNSSLQKSGTSECMSCGPVPHGHDEELISLQKRNRASTCMSCGPVKCDHDEQLLSSSVQKRNRASKFMSCGPVQHSHKQLMRSSSQKRNGTSKCMSCGPVQHGHEQLPSSSLQKSMASKSVPCGPVQHGHEQLPSSSLQKSMASKSVSCGPVQHDHEQLPRSSLQKRSMVSKSVSCGPGQHSHEQLPSSSVQKRSMASKSVSCGPVQHEHEQLPSSSFQKSLASKSVSCSPGQHDHEQLPRSSLQKRNMASKSVSCGPGQHDHEQLPHSNLQKKNTTSKSVSCGPGQHDHEQLPHSNWQTKNTASKSVSCGPGQHSHEQLPSSSFQKSMASKSVSCGPVQHDHEQLPSSSLLKRSMVSKSVSCGPVQHNPGKLLGFPSENHISQVEPQSENAPMKSSSLQDTPPARSSKESPQNLTTTETHHKDRSLSPQETSEPNLTSAQSQRVTTASPHNRWSGWMRVKGRIVKCLQRLCCCLPAQRRSYSSRRRVVPLEGGDNGVT